MISVKKSTKFEILKFFKIGIMLGVLNQRIVFRSIPCSTMCLLATSVTSTFSHSCNDRFTRKKPSNLFPGISVNELSLSLSLLLAPVPTKSQRLQRLKPRVFPIQLPVALKRTMQVGPALSPPGGVGVSKATRVITCLYIYICGYATVT